MLLEDLIKEGEALRDSAKLDGFGIANVLKGEGLEVWGSKCVIYFEENSENMFLIEKVKTNAKDLTNDGYDKCLAILGVLKATKEMTNV